MPSDEAIEEFDDAVPVRGLADAELVAVDDDRHATLSLDQLLNTDGDVTIALLGNGVIAGAVQVLEVGELEDSEEVDDA